MKGLTRTLRAVQPDVYHPPAVFPRHPPRLKRRYANPQLGRFALRLCWQAAWLLTTLFTMSLIGVLVLYGNQGEPPNPFSAYQTIMPGQNREDAIRLGAGCASANDTSPEENCILYPSDGPFKNVRMALIHGQIIAVSFIPKTDALCVGDLERLWGKPTVHPAANQDVVILQWSKYHIGAIASYAAPNEYSVIFLSVNIIASTGNSAPHQP